MPCMVGKIYLSSFQEKKGIVILNFLEWDFHNILKKGQSVRKLQIFLFYFRMVARCQGNTKSVYVHYELIELR